jgi:hypothetical protein
VVEQVTGIRIGRDHIAVAMRDHEPE